MAWVCTEAVRTQKRELVLGASLSEFMRKLGINSISGGAHRPSLSPQGSARVEEDQASLARVKLHDGQRGADSASLDPYDRTAQSRPARSLVSPFPPQGATPDGSSSAAHVLRAWRSRCRALLRLDASVTTAKFFHKFQCFVAVFHAVTGHPCGTGFRCYGSPSPPILRCYGSPLQVVKNK